MVGLEVVADDVLDLVEVDQLAHPGQVELGEVALRGVDEGGLVGVDEVGVVGRAPLGVHDDVEGAQGGVEDAAPVDVVGDLAAVAVHVILQNKSAGGLGWRVDKQVRIIMHLRGGKCKPLTNEGPARGSLGKRSKPRP